MSDVMGRGGGKSGMGMAFANSRVSCLCLWVSTVKLEGDEKWVELDRGRSCVRA